ncbi:DNA repair protein, partial [Vibrio parahaemolyticus]
MSVTFSRVDDPELYKDAYDEAQRIIRISDEIRISLEKISQGEASDLNVGTGANDTNQEKLTSSKLAKKLGLK